MAFHSQRKNPYEDVLKYRTEEDGDITKLFDSFYKADGFLQIKDSFDAMCKYLQVAPSDHRNLYNNIKNKLNVWRAKAFFAKLDIKREQAVYGDVAVGKHIKALVIGGGPCGLRAAIEIALLGGKVVVLEKRCDTTRNNVLALWPYVVEDLKRIGAKDFFPGFCVGGKDHISIRQLQCILLKTALLLGVEIHIDVEYKDLVEPPDDQSTGIGWRCLVEPSSHIVSNYQFNTVIGADGKRHGLSGFKRNEFRGKLAIAITANFINRKTKSDSMVPEICGLSYIYDQQFFKNMKSKTDIDLENIVYYKASTHYFVFTAKKDSLLRKGVLNKDNSNPTELLSKDNIDQDNLIAFAKETADEATDHKINNLEFALNKDGKADVAMFDFTCLCSAQYASRFVERKGHKLLTCIVGDSLLEPFWPTGTGAAIGFLSVFDSIWMIRQWYSGDYQPLEVLAERETLYQILPQCNVKSLFKDHKQYSIDPSTRYSQLSTLQRISVDNVKHQYDGESDNTDSVKDNTDSVTDKTVSVTDKTDSITDKTDSVTDKTDSITDETDNVTDKTDSVTDKTDSITDKTDSVTDKTDSITDKTDSITDKTDSITDETDDEISINHINKISNGPLQAD